MRVPRHVTYVSLLLALTFLTGMLRGQAVGDYRSVASGNWNTLATWNTWNGAAWVAPVATPNSTNGIITIQAGHTVSLNAAVTIDDVVVNGTLNTVNGVITTIANSATGVDLTINGTFGDNNAAASQIAWNAGATWIMGATGTLIRTNTSSSNNWQTAYQGGIANIPATSNWIIRRNAAAVPFSSTAPASGSVYPNLTVENNGGTVYTTAAAQSITGSAAFVTVKGNFDIGGAGTNVVDFLNNNTNANPTLVMGNVIVRAGCTMRNYGAGIEIRGNLTVNGTVSYDANDARRLVFSGAANQVVSGTGGLGVWDMTLTKTGGTVTLNRTMTVDNLSTFTQGVMISSSVNLLIIGSAGTVSGANNLSYVDGPVRYMGNQALTFPVGKSGDYQPIGISGYVSTGGAFWTENFNNGCTQLCLANGYNGWSVASTGTNGTSANDFYISCQENGNAVGACGSGCAGNATLHVGNVSTSPAAIFFCPTGDCGAAYDAGTGSGTCATSKRAQSPVNNCTGRSNITFSFKYMENGQGTSDNALAWYFDGTTWTMIADMAKTVLCGVQGTWTAYSINLPASANNNPNVRIGFQWVNNDDGAGSDPSFAVDDISLSTQEYFTAEYFHTNPQVPYGATVVPSLMYLSNCEYWILDRSPGSTASTSVTLAWDANSCPVWALTDLRVARYDGVSTWQNEGNTATTGTTAAGTVTSGVVTSFSPFTLAAITANPLPVTLVSFTAWYDDGVDQLEWITTSEINNDYFMVERANDEGEFIPIGRVDGHGTTSQTNYYHYTDTDPLEGNNHYRLRQVDYNGQYVYSPIRVVVPDQTGSLEILSSSSVNGVIDVAVVAVEGKTVQVHITDVAGREVYTEEEVIEDQPTHFVTSRLNSGVYFIDVSDGTKRITKKVELLNE